MEICGEIKNLKFNGNAKLDYSTFSELKKIANALKMTDNELFSMWKKRLMEYLKEGGFSITNNKELINGIFDGAKKVLTSRN